MRFLLLLLLSLYIGIASATPPPGYQIRVKINGYNRSELMLAYYLGGKTYVKDTARVTSDGQFVFSGTEELPAGMYLVVMQPDNNYFELLVDKKNQRFSCQTSQADPTGAMKMTGSADNTLLYQYINYLAVKRKEAEPLQAIIDSKQGDIAAAQRGLDAIDKTVGQYQTSLLQKHAGTLFATLLRAQVPAEKNLPEFDGNEEEVQRRQYEWARARWFDHLSLTDPFFLRTSFFLSRVNDYLDRMTVQDPDSLITSVDYLLTRSRPSEDVFKFLVVELLNRYASSRIMGLDKVYVHIAEKYYKSGVASWVDPEQRKKITENAAALKPILIGSKAPALRLETADGLGFDLNAFKADYTLLFFWQPASGNSIRQLNDLKKAAEKFRAKGLRVVTICTGKDRPSREQWTAALRQHQLEGLLNTYDANPSESGTGTYNLRTVPQLFLLDSQKIIRYKQIGAEQVEGIMERMLGKSER